MLQQYLFVMAVTLETPSRVTVVRQSQIILAYIVQVKTSSFKGTVDGILNGLPSLFSIVSTAEICKKLEFRNNQFFKEKNLDISITFEQTIVLRYRCESNM